MRFHVIAGLPRAGSTLLCNLLNQNPDFHATSTECIANLTSQISANFSRSLEFKNRLNINKDEAMERLEGSMRGFIEGFYKPDGKKVIFDKSRAWTHSSLQLLQLYPDAVMFVMVRDLRAVYGSIEKQNRKYGILDESNNYLERGLFHRASQMFGNQGIIGNPLEGIHDILRRNPSNVEFIQYENLSKNPKLVMERVYSRIGEKYFEHDFENVKNTSIDCDGFYLHKYPHNGSGKIVPCNEDEWKDYLSRDVARLIMEKYESYNAAFGYKKVPNNPTPNRRQ